MGVEEIRIAPLQSGFIEHTGEAECPVCGKRFAYTSAWAWRYAHTNLCSYTCMRWREKHREPQTSRAKPLTEEEKALVREMYYGGRTVGEIRATLKCKEERLRGYLGELGDRPRARKSGQGTNHVRLPAYWGQMQEIMQEHDGGAPWHVIAKRLGVSPDSLKYYARRYTGKTK